MQFHLMGCRDHACLLEQALELRFAEVGDADCLCFARLVAFLQCFVCVDIVRVAIPRLTVAIFGLEDGVHNQHNS